MTTDRTPLDAFIGRWSLDGKQYDSPFGGAAKIAAVETYEWLPGRAFLIHRFDGRVGDSDAACMEVIGAEPAKQGYRYRTFYNNGRFAEWFGRERGGVWVITGVWQMPHGATTVRCTTTLGAEGETLASTWEYSTETNRWQTFWDVRGKKVAGG
jgi:hypothetical protein